MKLSDNLTIVIPYYKKTFLDSTLLSLENQTSQNFKVFIGDDGSPEDPRSIINSFQGTLSIYYKKFENNLGSNSLTAHWHRCINNAPKSQWIMILGDDDMLSKNCVSNFYEKIDEVDFRKIRIIRFSSQIIDVENKKISKVHKHQYIENSTNFLFNKITGSARSSLSEYIFYRPNLEKKGFKNFPLAWHSDDLALIEFSNYGDILSIGNSRVYIRSSTINISGNKRFSKEKNLASYKFYKYLFINHQDILTAHRKAILISKLEKCVLNNRKNFFLITDISSLFLKNGDIWQYLKFSKKFIFKR
ncbi:glycosyltransferase family 2 protein [Autumnicola edwardsiae]|uniref:Glycosyltransferase family 2 protein n=1 Tax=Autumnicola edwardsiae TaxID=3075594 RepID=A0ABU3CR92_9FLAO|nr:glycosyltransferase family 2 protein [Zunongwangia sp. F297]MDT0648857.1 glycosyltransferase family 2 protein [Zunongwangia sp. F297]